MSATRKSIKSPSLKGPFAFDQASMQKAKRRLLRAAATPNEDRDRAFRRIILSIPPGKVSTYGQVAAAAGYPLYHRAVARLLRVDPPDQLPWHRVLGAGGRIRVPEPHAALQRKLLESEGVKIGASVDMKIYGWPFRKSKAKSTRKKRRRKPRG